MQVRERDMMGGLAKGLKVIEAFSFDRPRLSISDASKITGLDRATARRCLLTLAERGYCAYDGKFFTVTPRVLRLGTSCLASMPLPRLVQPWLDRLSETIGHGASVAILDGTEIVYVARAAERRIMSVTLMPGSRLPAYCTAMGRVLLAALSEAEAQALLESTSLDRRTEWTLTTVTEIMRELAEIKTLGFALCNQEIEIGLRSLAVPLLSARGKTVAALNVGLPVTSMSMADVVDKYLTALLHIQRELRKIL